MSLRELTQGVLESLGLEPGDQLFVQRKGKGSPELLPLNHIFLGTVETILMRYPKREEKNIPQRGG